MATRTRDASLEAAPDGALESASGTPAVWLSAVEVHLRNPALSPQHGVGGGGPRRLHAVDPTSLDPRCGTSGHHLLPTFERWPGSVQEGVERCDECSRLLPFRRRVLTNPRWQEPRLTDASALQWSYIRHPGPLGRRLMLLVKPLVSALTWLGCGGRLDVWPDGVTAGRFEYGWDDIERFETREFDIAEYGRVREVVLVPKTFGPPPGKRSLAAEVFDRLRGTPDPRLHPFVKLTTPPAFGRVSANWPFYKAARLNASLLGVESDSADTELSFRNSTWSSDVPLRYRMTVICAWVLAFIPLMFGPIEEESPSDYPVLIDALGAATSLGTLFAVIALAFGVKYSMRVLLVASACGLAVGVFDISYAPRVGPWECLIFVTAAVVTSAVLLRLPKPTRHVA